MNFLGFPTNVTLSDGLGKIETPWSGLANRFGVWSTTVVSKNNRIVSPNPSGGWDVKGGGSRASAHTATQKQAYAKAAQIVKNAGGGDVSVQGKNGQIREKNTIAPGNDPRKIKG